MEFGYATIMTWMKYLQYGHWKLNNNQLYSEDEIISKFNDLFLNELVREGNAFQGINPYKGMGYMRLLYSKSDNTFIVEDDLGYMRSYYLGLFENINGKKLALNKNIHGLDVNYFKYIDKEDKDFVFVSSIINDQCKEITPNIIRMIRILFLRQQPICEFFKRKETMFADYTKTEKEQILKECQKH